MTQGRTADGLLQPKYVGEPDSERPSGRRDADFGSSGALRPPQTVGREDRTYSPVGVFAPLLKVGANAVHNLSERQASYSVTPIRQWP